MRPLLPLAAALLLASCGDEPDPVTVPETQEPERIELGEAAEAAIPERPAVATATDTLGTFEGTVHGVAVWEHPALSYEGAVLAANGAAGLAIVSIDAEVPMQVVEGTFDGGVAVAYPEAGEALVAAGSGDDIILFRMGNDRVLRETARLDEYDIVLTGMKFGQVVTEVSQLETGVGTRALCLQDDLLLRVTKDGTAVTYSLDVTADTVVQARKGLYSQGAVVAKTDVVACGVVDSYVYVLTSTGDIEIVRSGEGGRSMITSAIYGEAVALAGVLTEGRQGFLIIGASSGELSVLRSGTFQAGSPTTKPLLDGEPFTVAHLAAGSGNFGSIYRDGVVAVLDDANALHLVPWAGLARALDLEAVSTITLRPQAAAAAPDFAVPSPQIAPPSLDQ